RSGADRDPARSVRELRRGLAGFRAGGGDRGLERRRARRRTAEGVRRPAGGPARPPAQSRPRRRRRRRVLPVGPRPTRLHQRLIRRPARRSQPRRRAGHQLQSFRRRLHAARYGAHVEKGALIMPGYVNIGAWVGAGTLVDTWATVGSCAQVGRNVHLSGGVGLGGVLEPPGARPVIVEDGAFIGSRCVVVEGVLVEEEAVLGAGVVLTASTPIIDVTGPQ